MPTSCGFEDYLGSVDAFIKTRPDLEAVRAYNHQMLDIFDSLRPLTGKSLLDVGASPHGFALEWALQKRVSAYTGIGLGISESVEVLRENTVPQDSLPTSIQRLARAARAVARIRSVSSTTSDRPFKSIGQLISMNAETLAFDADAFDLIISLSTFEHFFNGAQVLREMHRVLRPGGSMLISFQPVWTCSYGHHLHHVEPVAKMIPPWAHLLWNEEQMHQIFDGRWPHELPMSLEAAGDWIYRSAEVNRIDVVRIRDMFLDSDFEIEWMTPLMDSESDDKRAIVNYLSTILPYSADDLMTLGYSLQLNKR